MTSLNSLTLMNVSGISAAANTCLREFEDTGLVFEPLQFDSEEMEVFIKKMDEECAKSDKFQKEYEENKNISEEKNGVNEGKKLDVVQKGNRIVSEIGDGNLEKINERELEDTGLVFEPLPYNNEEMDVFFKKIDKECAKSDKFEREYEEKSVSEEKNGVNEGKKLDVVQEKEEGNSCAIVSEIEYGNLEKNNECLNEGKKLVVIEEEGSDSESIYVSEIENENLQKNECVVGERDKSENEEIALDKPRVTILENILINSSNINLNSFIQPVLDKLTENLENHENSRKRKLSEDLHKMNTACQEHMRHYYNDFSLFCKINSEFCGVRSLEITHNFETKRKKISDKLINLQNHIQDLQEYLK